MIGSKFIKKPIYFAGVMVTYSLLLCTVILIVSKFIDGDQTSVTSGGLAGTLLAGTTYVGKCKSMPSVKLRLIALSYFFIVQLAFVGAYIISRDIALQEKLPFFVVANLLYIFGAYFMVSLGASYRYKSMQRLNQNQEQDER